MFSLLHGYKRTPFFHFIPDGSPGRPSALTNLSISHFPVPFVVQSFTLSQSYRAWIYVQTTENCQKLVVGRSLLWSALSYIPLCHYLLSSCVWDEEIITNRTIYCLFMNLLHVLKSIVKCSNFTVSLSVFPGKWHLGVNCESRNDHCHHPLNHGFHYFYGMPFTLISDCQPTETPEMDRGFRRKLWLSTQVIGLIALTAALGRLTGLISVHWKIMICLFGFTLLYFISWFSSYGFVRYWNCIMMRNHEVTEQPMVTERTTSLILRESISFIER